MAEAGGTQILHESTTTRVWRLRGGGGRIVRKQAKNAIAQGRLDHERILIERLSGVAGIVRLGPDRQPRDALDLVDGGESLRDRLHAGALALDRFLDLALALARTVDAMHAAGVIHRDINPSNILLSSSADPVLIDFGSAIEADGDRLAPDGGEIVGTLGYLAPEQTGRTGRRVDQRADLYALGATFYELATGRMPFEDMDALRVIHDHLVREPQAPTAADSRVPPALSEIILRLLAKAPEQRYQSASGLAWDLSVLKDRLAAGNPASFDLGERDFPARLALPRGLIGREREFQALKEAFRRAQDSDARTLVIEGPAGVGKSALVNELRPLALAAGGWFVPTKFDQYQQDGAGGGGVVEAMRAFARVLLAQPPESLERERKRIVAALGRSAALVLRLLPEFGFLLEAQPEMADTDPQFAETQLQHASVRLLAAIVSPRQPLVLFLDDLQWADALSLRAFTGLMDDPQLRGLLLVGAYRTVDGESGSVLEHARSGWLSRASTVSRLEVRNLGLPQVADLLERILRLPRGEAHELAEPVFALARGNPFDTVELVNAMRTEGVLRLTDSGWEWERRDLRHFVGSGDVVDLLGVRIVRLPAAALELLEHLACLGQSRELPLLETACGRLQAELRVLLAPALDDGLVVAEHGDGREVIRFRHDRVQQAVLDRMQATLRGRRHLEMARRLASAPQFAPDAAQQFFACAPLLLEESDRRVAAPLLHAFAKALLKTASHALAERYLLAADELLAVSTDAKSIQLRGRIAVSLHAALYRLGRIHEADSQFLAVQEAAPDLLELGQAACLQVQSLNMRGQSSAALALGARTLGQLGFETGAFEFPDGATTIDALRGWVRDDSLLDPSTRAVLDDPRLLVVCELLYGMQRSAFLLKDMKAFSWLLFAAQRLWTEHGPCPNLLPTMCWLGGLVVGQRQDFRTGYEIGRQALTVGISHGWEPQASRARGQFANGLSHWFEPLETGIEHCVTAIAVFDAVGDIAALANTHISWGRYVLDVADAIEEPWAILEKGLRLAERAGNDNSKAHIACAQQFLRALRGETADGSFDDAHFEEKRFLDDVRPLRYLDASYFTYRALADLIMGDGALLKEHAAAAMAGLHDLPGHFLLVHVGLTYALSLAWQLQAQPSCPASDAMRGELRSRREWFSARAADQPSNFLHLRELVEAEAQWAEAQFAQAAQSFDSALRAVERTHRPWQSALITERAGLFHLACGLEGIGRRLLAIALRQYEDWGAAAKAERMRRDHDFLCGGAFYTDAKDSPAASRGMRRTSGVSLDSLDVVGLFRASQALSSETGIRRLTARVTELMTTLSGATKVLVVSCNDGQWCVLASDGSPVPVAEAIDRGTLPATLFGYVERTGDTLVIDDAPTDNRFARDPYFAPMKVCSVLMTPIAGQGGVRIMLYLENAQVRAAFNAERLDAVKLIAGQLAVSFSNAQLYEMLEERVQARTRELETTQEKLVATARRAGMAEIANNVLHNVGNVLNSINVSAGVVRHAIHASRTDALARAVGLMNEHAGALGVFLDSDPRGRRLLPYLNDLVDSLRVERQEMLADLDRLVRSVDHINYVVSAQQSLAGPSAVIETVRPAELVEESLRLGADAIARHGVTVVRDFRDVPAAELDKARVLQILVNLVDNAARAMESAPPESRRLTLAVSAAAEPAGERLRISVRDTGDGIATENLTRIFAHGFTTRHGGHGFGLHSSALAAVEMGGTLTARSDGPGQGSDFTLEVPLRPAKTADGRLPE